MKTSWLISALVLAACAAPSTTAQPSSTPSGATPGTTSEGGEAATPSSVASPASPTNAPAGAPSTEPSPPPPPGTPTLPAVAVKSVGMHIGGGPNDAEGKAPFEKAIEQRFPEFLRCYRLVSDPGKGGTFGVDLHIERGGGKPRVEQPRSALGGEPFRACMLGVFQGVDFPPLKKPSVVSYSLRFSVES